MAFCNCVAEHRMQDKRLPTELDIVIIESLNNLLNSILVIQRVYRQTRVEGIVCTVCDFTRIIRAI